MGTRIVRGHDVWFRAAHSSEDTPQYYHFRMSCDLLDTDGDDLLFDNTDDVIGKLFPLEAALRTLTAPGGLTSIFHIFDEVRVELFEETITDTREVVPVELPVAPEDPA